jgi:hypothetical protein
MEKNNKVPEPVVFKAVQKDKFSHEFSSGSNLNDLNLEKETRNNQSFFESTFLQNFRKFSENEESMNLVSLEFKESVQTPNTIQFHENDSINFFQIQKDIEKNKNEFQENIYSHKKEIINEKNIVKVDFGNKTDVIIREKIEQERDKEFKFDFFQDFEQTSSNEKFEKETSSITKNKQEIQNRSQINNPKSIIVSQKSSPPIYVEPLLILTGGMIENADQKNNFSNKEESENKIKSFDQNNEKISLKKNSIEEKKNFINQGEQEQTIFQNSGTEKKLFSKLPHLQSDALQENHNSIFKTIEYMSFDDNKELLQNSVSNITEAELINNDDEFQNVLTIFRNRLRQEIDMTKTFFNIRLMHASLGSVEINLNIDGTKVHPSFFGATKAMRENLNKNRKQIVSILKEANLDCSEDLVVIKKQESLF